MKEIKSTCPACGAVLPGSAPLGLCPKCLADLGESEPTVVKESLSALDAARAIDSHPDTATSAHPESHPSNLPDRLFAHAFGDYELLEEIARGGMGVVYRARHRSLNRIVAVKMILSAQFAGQQFGQRFRNEAAAAAILQHPNIVAIHDVGVQDGQQFFSMNYVEGQNLAQLVGNRPLPPARAARYLKLIAEAIHYAHDQGILHQPRITDFGLAKRLDGTSSLTVTGQVLGSPSFMPPEQAGSDRGKVGRPSDVYALGGILYFLLTGRAPFQAESLEAIVTQVLHSEPVSPRLLNPVVPRDLETICLKCLEKQPDKRYSTAQQLAEELNRFLRGEPIQARPVSAPERLWRWCYRKPATAASLATIALLLLIVLIGSPIALIRINRARQQSEALRKQDAHSLYIAKMNLARQAWEENNINRLTQLLEETRDSPHRGFEWSYWQRQIHQEVRTFRGHEKEVIAVAFSPDGQRIFSGSLDQAAKVWDVNSGRELFALKSGGNTQKGFVAFSPDGSRIVRGEENRAAAIWDGSDGRKLLKLEGHTAEVVSAAFSRDGRRIVTGSADNTAIVWDAGTGLKLRVLKGHKGEIQTIAFSPDDRLIATAGMDNTARVWAADTGEELFSLEGHSDHVWSVGFSPDGRRIITGSKDGTATVWDGASRERLLLLELSQNVESAGFSPDGKKIVTTTTGQTAELWDAETGRRLRTFKGHRSNVIAAAFSPDGQHFITCSGDKTIKLWNLEAPPEPLELRGHTHQIWCVAFSPNRERIVTGCWDRTARVWDSRSGRELLRLEGHALNITRVAFSPDGQRIATSSWDQTARIWDATTGIELRRLEAGVGAIMAARFSPDGQRIVTAAEAENTAKVWEVNSGKIVLTLSGHTNYVNSASFSPDGRRILTGSLDGTARIWDAASGQELLRLENQSDVYTVAFSTDGKRILTGGGDFTAKVWDADTGELQLNIQGHGDQVMCGAFSPDDRRILTSSWDRTARLWDAATGREVLTLKGHDGAVLSIAFSPDGLKIVTASYDRTAKIWQAATPEQVRVWQEEETQTAKAHALLQRDR
jgi:WD40 repeat protein